MRIEFLLWWYPDLLPHEICISIVSISRRTSEGEIDRKNQIFGRKTDILRKFVSGCAILLNIYGKKD